jgi:hypothetical protein
MTKPTVAEVRADKELGVGSCSVVDECYTDEELQDWIDRLAAPDSGVDDVMEFMKSINREQLMRMEDGYGY